MRLYKYIITLMILVVFLGAGFTYADDMGMEYFVENIDTYMTVNTLKYGIFINSEPIGYLETEQEAKNILTRLKSIYLDEEREIIEYKYKENVKISKDAVRVVDKDMSYSEDNLFELIVRGTNERKTHVIESGDNFWDIAIKYDIKLDDLVKANPEVVPERLQINQEISLIVPKPLITVVMVEEAVYLENIAFDVVYEDSSAYYKGDYRTKIYGIYGKLDIVANVYKENGIEVERQILSETIIKNPSTKVVYRGTKDPPPRIGTGTFDYPYDVNRGYVTSRFGMRWGRRHNGIDIGLPVGTPIYAADGGRVVSVGTNGGYGMLIKIDHGANIETLYGHLSKYYVSVGDMVYKGEKIALSGNTGFSTGPHLHFEVREIGIPKNPEGYLNFY